jgi:hypothetical protein
MIEKLKPSIALRGENKDEIIVMYRGCGKD